MAAETMHPVLVDCRQDPWGIVVVHCAARAKVPQNSLPQVRSPVAMATATTMGGSWVAGGRGPGSRWRGCRDCRRGRRHHAIRSEGVDEGRMDDDTTAVPFVRQHRDGGGRRCGCCCGRRCCFRGDVSVSPVDDLPLPPCHRRCQLWTRCAKTACVVMTSTTTAMDRQSSRWSCWGGCASRRGGGRGSGDGSCSICGGGCTTRVILLRPRGHRQGRSRRPDNDTQTGWSPLLAGGARSTPCGQSRSSSGVGRRRRSRRRRRAWATAAAVPNSTSCTSPNGSADAVAEEEEEEEEEAAILLASDANETRMGRACGSTVHFGRGLMGVFSQQGFSPSLT